MFVHEHDGERMEKTAVFYPPTIQSANPSNLAFSSTHNQIIQRKRNNIPDRLKTDMTVQMARRVGGRRVNAPRRQPPQNQVPAAFGQIASLLLGPTSGAILDTIAQFNQYLQGNISGSQLMRTVATNIGIPAALAIASYFGYGEIAELLGTATDAAGAVGIG